MTTTHMPARPGLQPARDDFEKRYGVFGKVEQRELPIDVEEIRESGAGDGQFTLRGHAAVFDQFSLDLGGFREKIDRAAFDNALSRNPDVWLLWDHDTRYVLGRTTNKSLELRIDPRGLHYWARIAPTSYAADLRVLMERGDIDQASFAFTVERDDWHIIEGEDGAEDRVERTILEVGELYDVTVTAMGAYPQTDSQIVRQRAHEYATRSGRLPDVGAETSPLAAEGDVENRVAPDDPVGEEPLPDTQLADLKASTRQAVSEMRERHLQAMKELSK